MVCALLGDCRLFFYINVPKDSVVTQVRFGGIFNKDFAANLLENMTVKQF